MEFAWAILGTAIAVAGVYFAGFFNGRSTLEDDMRRFEDSLRRAEGDLGESETALAQERLDRETERELWRKASDLVSDQDSEAITRARKRAEDFSAAGGNDTRLFDRLLRRIEQREAAGRSELASPSGEPGGAAGGERNQGVEG